MFEGKMFQGTFLLFEMFMTLRHSFKNFHFSINRTCSVNSLFIYLLWYWFVMQQVHVCALRIERVKGKKVKQKILCVMHVLVYGEDKHKQLKIC